MAAISDVQTGGPSKFDAALQVAQLALKHRQNKNQRQRIVVFVGSPLAENDEDSLTKLGKKLKKNNVSIDIVNFGEGPANQAKLAALVEAAQGSEPSHLVTVEPGHRMLSDALLSTPIVMSGDGSGSVMNVGGGGPGAGQGDFDLGVDPNMDPELALALRISAEEARLEEQQRAAAAANSASATAGTGAGAAAAPAAAVSGGGDGMIIDAGLGAAGADFDDEEAAALQAALALSLAEAQAPPPSAGAAPQPAAAAAAAGSLDAALQDPKYIESLLSGLAGVTPDVAKTMEELNKDKKSDDKKKEHKDDDHLYD